MLCITVWHHQSEIGKTRSRDDPSEPFRCKFNGECKSERQKEEKAQAFFSFTIVFPSSWVSTISQFSVLTFAPLCWQRERACFPFLNRLKFTTKTDPNGKVGNYSSSLWGIGKGSVRVEEKGRDGVSKRQSGVLWVWIFELYNGMFFLITLIACEMAKLSWAGNESSMSFNC